MESKKEWPTFREIIWKRLTKIEIEGRDREN